jgi:hypothetical protein
MSIPACSNMRQKSLIIKKKNQAHGLFKNKLTSLELCLNFFKRRRNRTHNVCGGKRRVMTLLRIRPQHKWLKNRGFFIPTNLFFNLFSSKNI